MNKNLYEALSSAIYVSRQTLSGTAIETDDQRIRASGLYESWMPGAYQVGDIRNTEDQTWECYADHDLEKNPGIEPGASAWFTFWRPLHGKTPETARPFVPVQGSHDLYKQGECMIWTDGTIKRALRDTNFSPADNAADWEDVTS